MDGFRKCWSWCCSMSDYVFSMQEQLRIPVLTRHPAIEITRVGQNHIYIRRIYGLHRRDYPKYTAYIYGSGQP